MASVESDFSMFVKTELTEDHLNSNEEIEEYQHPLFVKMEVEDDHSQTSIPGKRKGKISFEQKQLMIDFLSSHPEMISSSSSPYTVNASRPLWNELQYLLENSVTGVRGKTLEEWKRTWQDIKSTTKKRANEVANNKTIAGGPPKPLTEIELAILSLMKISTIPVPSPGDNESSLEAQTSQNEESVDSATISRTQLSNQATVINGQAESSQINHPSVPPPSRISKVRQNQVRTFSQVRKKRKATLTNSRLLKKFISVQEECFKLKRDEFELKKKISETKLEMLQGMIKYYNAGAEAMLKAGELFRTFQK